MADNITLPGTGVPVATDDDGTNHHQYVKLEWGPDNTFNKVDTATGKPLPVQERVSDGTAYTFGAGSVSAGTQRATLASDDPAVVALQIMDDWDETNRCAVNLISGQVGIAGGTGTDGATVPRVTLATNVALPAGTNAIGKLAANSGVDIGDVDVTSISAGENHLGEIGGKTAVVAVTLSTDTSAYASGDLIADTQQIDAFFRKTDGTGVINSINIIDEDAQGVALYVIFMSTSTSLGTENSAPNISDANLTAGFQGIVAVATTDYVTISGAKVATIRNIGLPVKAVSGTDDIYIAVLNETGTPTFTATGLEMRIGVLLD